MCGIVTECNNFIALRLELQASRLTYKVVFCLVCEWREVDGCYGDVVRWNACESLAHRVFT